MKEAEGVQLGREASVDAAKLSPFLLVNFPEAKK
jgi:hypothetical protein